MCHVPCAMCHVSHIACHVSRVTCHMSLMPAATATDPPLDATAAVSGVTNAQMVRDNVSSFERDHAFGSEVKN